MLRTLTSPREKEEHLTQLLLGPFHSQALTRKNTLSDLWPVPVSPSGQYPRKTAGVWFKVMINFQRFASGQTSELNNLGGLAGGGRLGHGVQDTRRVQGELCRRGRGRQGF